MERWIHSFWSLEPVREAPNQRPDNAEHACPFMHNHSRGHSYYATQPRHRYPSLIRMHSEYPLDALFLLRPP
jgi:hypothetical protein